MAEQVILAESYVTVLADERVPCIIVQLHAFANRIQFKAFMEAGLAYYQAHATPGQRWGWIADTRQMSAIPMEVQDWLAQDWNARAYAAGLREMSIVTSTNILGQLATQLYAKKAVLDAVYYDSLAQAKHGVRQRLRALNGS